MHEKRNLKLIILNISSEKYLLYDVHSMEESFEFLE